MSSKFIQSFVILVFLSYNTFAFTDLTASSSHKNYALPAMLASPLVASVASMITVISIVKKYNETEESSRRDRQLDREEINKKEQEIVISRQVINALKNDCLINEETVNKLQKALSKQKNLDKAQVESNKDNDGLCFYYHSPDRPIDCLPTKKDVIELARLIKAWMFIFALTGIEWDCGCCKSCGEPGFFRKAPFICDRKYIDKIISGCSIDNGNNERLRKHVDSLCTIAKNNPYIALPVKYKGYVSQYYNEKGISFIESTDDFRKLMKEWLSNENLSLVQY